MERLVADESLTREDLISSKTKSLNIKNYKYDIRKDKYGFYDRYTSQLTYKEGMVFKKEVQVGLKKYNLKEAGYIRTIDFLNSLEDLIFNRKTKVGEDNEGISEQKN